MNEYKEILGLIAIGIAIISYAIYFRQIIVGKIIPHAFSWFIWSITTGTIFAAQIVSGGGAGAWVTGFTSAAVFAFFVLAFVKGSRKFHKIDWVFLALALSSLVLWWLTKQPLLSVILITLTDLLAAVPTIRKAYHKPYEDSATLFGISALKFVVALFALQSLTLVTWLYPASVVFGNTVITLVIIIRRQQLQNFKQ